VINVCLVQMPFGGVERPCLALSLLKAYLSVRSISSRVVYANLAFADAIGLDVYHAIAQSQPESLIGEWAFGRAVFGEASGREAEFLDLIAPCLESSQLLGQLRRIYGHLDTRRLVSAVRGRTPEFVDRTARSILDLEPRIVGCTSTFQQHCGALALLQRIKELSPGVITMLGGANCEGVMGAATHRKFPYVDFVASGEVDAFFAGFCERLLKEGADVPLEELPCGIFGPAHRVAPAYPDPWRAVLQSLDEAAVPDFDDYFESLRASGLAGHIKPYLSFESSRGCWWGMKQHCTFCGLNGEGMAFRSKSGPRVLEEIAALRARYGIHDFAATDNILDMRHMTSVLPALATLENPPFLFYEVKANMRRNQVALMSAAGVRRIQPGIESLHDDVLKLLKKGNSWFINVQLLKWAQEFGIRVAWNFLAGAPGESEAWYREMIDWLPLLFHLEPPDGNVAHIRYDRFSPYQAAPREYGLTLVPSRAYEYVYPVPPHELADLAYYYEDAAISHRVWPSCHEALAAAITDWDQAFTGTGDQPAARLLGRDNGDHVLIHDTRAVASSPEITLVGLDYLVWKACDSARSLEGLSRFLKDTGQLVTSSDEISVSVERLKELKVLLEWRGMLLSLTVSEPVIPYIENGFGFVRMSELREKRWPESLVRECIRPRRPPLPQLVAGPSGSRFGVREGS